MTKRKVRKPKYLDIPGKGQAYFYSDRPLVDINLSHGNAKDCRKLAAWLIKAADWLDQQSEGDGE